jgi:hypothetical protein
VPSCEGFSFVPFSVDLSVGEIYEDFRISVPKDTNDNEYIINWDIIGELNPLFYTPISKTRFEVTKNQDIKVRFEPIMPVPRNGTSLPHRIIIDNAPDVNLVAHLSLSSSATAGIEVNPARLEF